jgi:hypothetical protein
VDHGVDRAVAKHLVQNRAVADIADKKVRACGNGCLEPGRQIVEDDRPFAAIE